MHASSLTHVDVLESDPRWDRIDSLIFAGARIRAVAALREDFGLPLPEAIEQLDVRFNVLCEKHRECFKVPLSNYWDEFYS